MQRPPLIIHDNATVRLARAEEVHYRQGGGPFIQLCLAEIPDTLQEAELFGMGPHYFGLGGAREGHIAIGGSCFLDPITEAGEGLMTRLAYYLESGTFCEIGSTQLKRSDTRIILGAENQTPLLAHIIERLHARVA